MSQVICENGIRIVTQILNIQKQKNFHLQLSLERYCNFLPDLFVKFLRQQKSVN